MILIPEVEEFGHQGISKFIISVNGKINLHISVVDDFGFYIPNTGIGTETYD